MRDVCTSKKVREGLRYIVPTYFPGTSCPVRKLMNNFWVAFEKRENTRSRRYDLSLQYRLYITWGWSMELDAEQITIPAISFKIEKLDVRALALDVMVCVCGSIRASNCWYWTWAKRRAVEGDWWVNWKWQKLVPALAILTDAAADLFWFYNSMDNHASWSTFQQCDLEIGYKYITPFTVPKDFMLLAVKLLIGMLFSWDW